MPHALICCGSAAEKIGETAFRNLSWSLIFTCAKSAGEGHGNELDTEHLTETLLPMLYHPEGHRMAIVLSCLGGTSGRVLAPLVVRWCREQGMKCSVIAVMPFGFDANAIRVKADRSLTGLRAICSDVVVIRIDIPKTEELLEKTRLDAIGQSNRLVLYEIAAILNRSQMDSTRSSP